MPLAVQPSDPNARRCLVRDGPEEIKRAYRNLFVGGYSGIIEEIRYGILEYGKILREASDNELSVKQRLRYLNTRVMMLERLARFIRRYGQVEDTGNEPVTIETGET